MVRKNIQQGAADIMAGVAEIEAMLRDGVRPEERFTVRTIGVPEPGNWKPAAVRKLRDQLEASQGVFAAMLGVSRILVQSWERGVREPAPVARRLLDTIKADPAGWLATVRRRAKAG